MLNEIHERAEGLVQPDTMLPSQFFDRVRRRSDLTGEQRLMCAIIEDAVEMYRKNAGVRDPLHEKLFLDAEEWIETHDSTWIFSFETICDVLGLEPDALRRGLRAIKRRARGEDAVVSMPDVAGNEAGHRRASNE
jgi:hypothetical protein